MWIKNIYKTIAIAIIFLILGTVIGYTYSDARKKRTTTSTNYQKNIPINKSVNNNNHISTKSVPIDSTNITPFSSETVIYNSHADEDYPSGIRVTYVGALINDKLVKEGLKSSFIKCNPPTEHTKSYQITRDLITKNVKDYSNTILLDIHRDITENTKSDTKKYTLYLLKTTHIIKQIRNLLIFC